MRKYVKERMGSEWALKGLKMQKRVGIQKGAEMERWNRMHSKGVSHTDLKRASLHAEIVGGEP